MTAAVLLAHCRDLGVTLAPGPEGRLRVSPAGVLPEALREELKRRKAEVLELLTEQPGGRARPHLTERGELIIPCDCAPGYCWWAGGQSVAATLAELHAPPEVWARYTAVPFGRVQ
jgi:hypothetical protein